MDGKDVKDGHMARHMSDGDGERKHHSGRAIAIVAIVLSCAALGGNAATLAAIRNSGAASSAVIADTGISYADGADRHDLAVRLSGGLDAADEFVPDADGFYDLGNGTSVRIDAVRATYSDKYESTTLSVLMTARNDTGHTTQVTTVWRAYANGEQVGGVLYGSTASIQDGVQASLTASTAIDGGDDLDKVDLVFGVSPVDSMTVRDVPVMHYEVTDDGETLAR